MTTSLHNNGFTFDDATGGLIIRDTGPGTSLRRNGFAFDDATGALVVAGSSTAVLREAPLNPLEARFGGDLQATVNYAASAATGGEIYIPPGTYLLSAPLVIPNFVKVRGAGQATILQATGNNYCVSFGPGNRSEVRDLLVQASSPQAAGGGFDFRSAANNVKVEDVYLGLNLHTGVDLRCSTAGAGIFWLHRLRWFGVAGCTYGLRVGSGSNLVTDIEISDCIGTAATTGGMTQWWDVKNNVDTLDVHDSTFYQGGTGAVIGEAAATGSVTGAKWTNVVIDAMAGVGVDVTRCRDLLLAQNTIQTCGSAQGLNVGEYATGLRWRDGLVQNCAANGIVVRAGARHTSILGAQISDNNTSAAAFTDGIQVIAGGSEFMVSNCDIGHYLLGHTGAARHRYGISIEAGASDYYQIQNNRLGGNATGGLADGGTGVNKVTSGNL